MDSEGNATNLVAQKYIKERIASHCEWIAYHDERVTYHEERIVHNNECIRMLKEERNMLEPISRLPPEILAAVFVFVLAEYHRTLENFPFPLYYFTHVSRSWRSVALNMPHLWQVIVPIRRRWTIAALERSKTTDLILRSGLRSLDSHAVLFLKQVLTEHASRVRELDINLDRFFYTTVEEVFEVLQQPSLRLHSLQLTSRITLHSYPTFPTGIVTDNLRKLEIRNCSGPWYSMSFPALTTLNLCQIDNRPPLNDFLELLRGLATLQVLDMEDSLPRSKPANCPVDPIHLPSLQYLRLCSTKNRKEVSNLLSCITVPPTATLIFVLMIGRSNDMVTSFSAFFSQMAQSPLYSTLHILSCSTLCPPFLHSVCPSLSGAPGHIHLRAWNDDDGNISTVAPKLDVFFALKEWPAQIVSQKVVRKIFPSLPLFNITTITLEIVPVGALLRHTIGNLPHLQKVTVVGRCMVKFVKELTRRRESYDDTQLSDYYSVPFPALEFLWIQKGNFNKEGSCMVEELQDCLMERYERNAEILKLKFTDCRGLCRSYVEKLREIVVDVEWDEN